MLLSCPSRKASDALHTWGPRAWRPAARHTGGCAPHRPALRRLLLYERSVVLDGPPHRADVAAEVEAIAHVRRVLEVGKLVQHDELSLRYVATFEEGERGKRVTHSALRIIGKCSTEAHTERLV